MFIAVMKVIGPTLVALLGVWRLIVSKDKKIAELMAGVSRTNDLLVQSLENNGDLLRELNSNFERVNDKLLIDSDNSASIMKTAIFNDFGQKWTNSMMGIFSQNHLNETDKTIKKIQGSTYTLLKSTCEKSLTIPGLKHYLPSVEDVLEVLKVEDVYQKTLKLMITCKSTGDLGHLKDELYSLYQVTYSILDK